MWQQPSDVPLDLPDEFQPISTASPHLPADKLVLVPLAQWALFYATIEPDDEGRYPYTLLYLSDGASPPDDYSEYADDIVHHKDWDTLRHYTQHFLHVQAEDWIETFSRRDLDQLPDRLIRRDLSNLPLSHNIQHRLGREAALLDAFNDVVAARRAQRWQDHPPTAYDLGDYLRGALSLANEPYIKAYLAHSPVGQAKFAVLRQEHCLSRITVPITPDIREALLERKAEQIRWLLLALWRANLRPYAYRRYTGRRSGDTDTSKEPQPERVFADVLAGKPGRLVKDGYTMNLQIEQGALMFDAFAATKEGSILVFFLEFYKDDVLIAYLASTKGQLHLPMKILFDSVAQEIDHLAISAAKPKNLRLF